MLLFLSMLESDGERRIFSELYNQYGNAMLRVARRYFPEDPQDAEDAVQNAWLKVIKNILKIQEIPCKKRGAYLVIIVRNEAIAILRKRRRELPFEDALAGEAAGLGDDSGKPVIELIRAMPDTYRAVLEMRFVEERSTKEIAAALHLTETAVNTRIHRGRAILIEKLREEGICNGK